MKTMDTTDTMDPVEEGRQHVTFSLNDETYAVAAENVLEIVELSGITRVPHLPEFLRGVINLRGTVIPVVDLKLKFGMAADGYRKHTCVIVTEFSGGVMGLIVDAVSDVLNIPDGSVSPAPAFGTAVNTDFIQGMARFGAGLAIVLDIEKVLSAEETADITRVRGADGDGDSEGLMTGGLT